MEMSHRDPSLHQQNPRSLNPLLRRKNRPRRSPLKALPLQTPLSILHPRHLQPPSHHPSLHPKLPKHQLKERCSPFPRLHQNHLHRQTRRHDQPRKARARPNINPPLASQATQPRGQSHHLEPLGNLLRQRGQIPSAAEIHRPPEPKPLPSETLEPSPRQLVQPDRRCMRSQ